MKLWPSRFNVAFEVPAEDGRSVHILQNLFCGHVNFLDPAAAPLLPALTGGTSLDLTLGGPGGERFVDRLVAEGFLYRDPQGETELIGKYVAAARDRETIVLRHRGSQYGFLPTYACNLRCPYCFQRDLRSKTSPMTTEMVDLAFAAIDRLEERAPQRREELATLGGSFPVPGVAIAGGEPLLPARQNRLILERIVQN